MYNNSQKAIAESPPEKKVTWSYIKTTLSAVLEKIKKGKFEDPKNPNLKQFYDALTKEIDDSFLTLLDN
jgi:hypothetical protein